MSIGNQKKAQTFSKETFPHPLDHHPPPFPGFAANVHPFCCFLGEVKWGRTKYRRIPESEGDGKGRVPKCSSPGELFKTRDLELPCFEGSLISPKLFTTLHGIHPHLSTPVRSRASARKFGEDWGNIRPQSSQRQSKSNLVVSNYGCLTPVIVL